MSDQLIKDNSELTETIEKANILVNSTPTTAAQPPYTFDLPGTVTMTAQDLQPYEIPKFMKPPTSMFQDEPQNVKAGIVKCPTLSILICTVLSRKEKCDAILRMLYAQRNYLVDPGQVQILVESDDGTLTVGAKRNKLLDAAQGEYLCFCDDDDRIFADYLERILKALETKPDVVGITIFWTDDIYTRPRLLIRSLEYGTVHWMPNVQEGVGCGRPAHLNPIRSDIAKTVRFNEELASGEDADWSARMLGKLKTCVFIEEPIYHYDFRSKGSMMFRPRPRKNMLPPLPEGHQWVIRDGKIVELDTKGMVVKREEKK
jgi:hypothetical protein